MTRRLPCSDLWDHGHSLTEPHEPGRLAWLREQAFDYSGLDTTATTHS